MDKREKDEIVVEFTEDNLERFLKSKTYDDLDLIETELLELGYMPFGVQEYKNTNTKILLIDEENYIYYTTIGRLRKGQVPKMIGVNNPYSIENIKNWTSIHRPDEWIILSDVYKNNEKLKLHNIKYNIDCEISWKHFKQGSSGDEIRRIESRLSIDEVKENVNEAIHTVEVISNEWDTTLSKIKCKCNICDNEFSAWYANLIKGEGCPICGVRKREKHWSWKGGITPLYINVRNATLPWKINSYKKYNYKCDITGKKLKSNVVHHPHNYCDILQETLNVLNVEVRKNIGDYSDKELSLIKSKCLELHYKYGLGICLTKEIHEEFHQIYGKRNNTLEQYLEFKNDKLKENINAIKNNSTITNVS